jgi:hypothetical protein
MFASAVRFYRTSTVVLARSHLRCNPQGSWKYRKVRHAFAAGIEISLPALAIMYRLFNP